MNANIFVNLMGVRVVFVMQLLVYRPNSKCLHPILVSYGNYLKILALHPFTSPYLNNLFVNIYLYPHYFN